jgi:hypothetical protein
MAIKPQPARSIHNLAPPARAGHTTKRFGPWCGIARVVFWAPMLLVIPLFPALDSQLDVVAYWRDHGSLTLAVIAPLGTFMVWTLCASLAWLRATTPAKDTSA